MDWLTVFLVKSTGELLWGLAYRTALSASGKQLSLDRNFLTPK
ncbi:MAG: hypothetical protein ACLP19_19205 [Xanthobacteraceae bacterium]